MQPHHPAVVFMSGRCADGGEAQPVWRHLTFGELAARSDAFAWGLREYGFKPGVKTLLMIRPTLDFYALVFAVLKTGAVPVLIDPGMGWRGFLRCVRQVAPEAFIGIAQAHILRLACRRAFRDVKLNVTMGARRFWGGRTLPELLRHSHCGERFPIYEPQNADELAAVLFTSGSTGPAKGVCYTHEIFAGQCKIVKRLCGIERGEFDLACFPLFSLFSIANGATAVVPEMDATHPASINPECVREAVRQWPISYSFGSPALWKHVADYCVAHNYKLPGIKRIFMSGAPVPPQTHRNLRAILDDDASTYAPYGCTEALPIAILDGATVLDANAHAAGVGKGTCVGSIIPEIHAKIIRITDDALPVLSASDELPDGEIGELCVSGLCVTRSYYGRPDADALSKCIDEHGVLWHRVGDVGYFDEQKRFWFCGRKAHRVETAQCTLFSIPTESYFNCVEGVARSALAGVGDKTSRRAVIVIECKPDCKVELAALQKVIAENSCLAPISAILFYPGSFPVDVRHNAKINREALSRWAEKSIRNEKK